MLVKIDLSNLNKIEATLHISSRKLSRVKIDLMRKKNSVLLAIENDNKQITRSIRNAHTTIISIDNELEDLISLFENFIYDSEYLVYGENAHDGMAGWLFEISGETFENILATTSIIVDYGIGVSFSASEIQFNLMRRIGMWIDDNKEVIFEIVLDIAIIVVGVVLIIATGGSALMIVGAGIMMMHALMELNYDIEALGETDLEKKELIRGKTAENYYQNELGLGDKTGAIVYNFLNIVSVACMAVAGKMSYKDVVALTKPIKGMITLAKAQISGELSMFDVFEVIEIAVLQSNGAIASFIKLLSEFSNVVEPYVRAGDDLIFKLNQKELDMGIMDKFTVQVIN